MDPFAVESTWSDSVSQAAKALWGITLEDRHKPFVEAPQDPKHGDAISGVAMKLAKDLKKPPRAIADELKKKLDEMKPEGVEKIDVAGAGFVNFTASRTLAKTVIEEARSKGADFGRSAAGAGEKVLVEHTSANPTGPLHIAHARQAAVGDSIANVLEFAGYAVTREFYVNDTGNQIANLGRSVLWRIAELKGGKFTEEVRGTYDEEIKEKDGTRKVVQKPNLWLVADLGPHRLEFQERNVYKGEYVKEFAAELDAAAPGMLQKPIEQAVKLAADFGKRKLLDEIKRDLAAFRVRFDVWTSQVDLEASGKVESFVAELKRRGLTYEKDGALWIKGKEIGHGKDNVLVKSTGEYTYRTPDTAYHLDKFARGFTRVVDLWGPDHHEHIGYMTTTLKAFGHEGFKVLIVQICHLFKDGREIKFSKRTGNMPSLKELVEDAGVDPSRITFAMRKTDSPFNVDIDVLKSTSMDNPFWYVGYAHARISSIVRKGIETGQIPAGDVKETTWQGSFDPAALGERELLLLRHVRQFRRVLERAARDYDPTHFCEYLRLLSTEFQSYYTAGNNDPTKRVLVEDETVRRARLATCAAVQIAIRNGLRLLGAQAPERLASQEE